MARSRYVPGAGSRPRARGIKSDPSAPLQKVALDKLADNRSRKPKSDASATPMTLNLAGFEAGAVRSPGVCLDRRSKSHGDLVKVLGRGVGRRGFFPVIPGDFCFGAIRPPAD
jgi:hypothetical protein